MNCTQKRKLAASRKAFFVATWTCTFFNVYNTVETYINILIHTNVVIN